MSFESGFSDYRSLSHFGVYLQHGGFDLCSVQWRRCISFIALFCYYYKCVVVVRAVVFNLFFIEMEPYVSFRWLAETHTMTQVFVVFQVDRNIISYT